MSETLMPASPSTNAPLAERSKFVLMFYDVAAGTIFVLFNFNGFIRYAANKWLPSSPTVQGMLVQVSHFPDLILPTTADGKTGLLGTVLYLCFIGLWLYLGAVLLLAVVRGKPRIALNGVIGFSTGVFSVAILGWLEVIIVAILGVLLAIGRVIFGILAAIWEFLAPIIHWIVVALGWIIIVAVPLLALAGIVYGLYWLIKRFGLKFVIGALAAGTILYFVWPILVELYRNYILPVLQWIGMVLNYLASWIVFIVAWVLKALIVVAIAVSALGLILVFVGSLGRMMRDQLESAWKSGSGSRGILVGSFSVGLALAIVLWVSSGSVELSQLVATNWQSITPVLGDISPVTIFNTALPASIAALAPAIFGSSHAPLFDALSLLVILIVSYFGIARGFRPRHSDEYHATFFSQDVLKLGGLMILALPALALVVLAASAPHDE